MPRHGARELRGPRDCGRTGEVLHFREGGSGGAPRPRCRLHGGHTGIDGVGGLAHVRLLHTRRAALLRRDLLPSGRAPRHAVVPPRRAGPGRRLDQRAGSGTRAGRCTGGRRATRAPPGRGAERRGGGRRAAPAARPCCGWPARRPGSGLDAEALVEQVVAGVAAGFDPEWGGFGPAPKFPRPSLVELCLRRGPSRPVGCGACPPYGPAHARRHGGGWHLRPHRRRVLPLLDRRPVAGTPLREDAHRPGPAGPGLSPRVAGRRTGGVPGCGHRDAGLRPARPLDARGRARTRPSTPMPVASKAHTPRSRSRNCAGFSPRPSSGRQRSGTASPPAAIGRDGPFRSAPSEHRWSAHPRWRKHECCWPRRGPGGSSRPGTRRC